jgi:hypothetical protein
VIIIDLGRAINYLFDTSKSTNKLQWVLIIIALSWYLIAMITTWMTMSINGTERNPLAAMVFNYFGMIPTCIVMFTIITLIMIHIPYICRDHKRIGIMCNTIFLIFFFLDGGHNTAIVIDINNVLLSVPYNITENIYMYLGL